MQTLNRIAAAVALLLSARTRPCLAALPCSSDDECSSLLRDGSFCVDGFCSNPFVQGCLKTVRDDADPSILRACNSDDKKAGNTECIDFNDSFGYAEIRIHNGDWESSIFFAWIMQIVLMEVLHVPATVGLSSEVTAISSFYSPRNTLEYSSKSYGWEALRDAGACEETSEECVHVLPEVWNGQIHEWTKAMDEGFIKPIEANGQVGKMSWSIPSFMLQHDSTLASYYGLRGEENRRKLAEAFLKPTTWEEYCEEISPNTCSTSDGTAQHYPEDADKTKYFDPSGYTGHFRATLENNCTAFPDACVGHFIAPPCRWSTNVDAQLYWNDINLLPTGPLLNGGYEYSSMLEIWRAANATKSNVMMWWWSPETLNEEFYDTDAALEQVLLPRATYACSRARTDAAARCSEDIVERRGAPLGSCDQEAHSLRKIISERFVEDSKTAAEARKSPAAEFVKNMEISSSLDMDKLLYAWVNRTMDMYGNDAREAVCAWVDDNLDSIMEFVPEGYPRTISKQSPYDTALMNAATALGFVAAGAVCICSNVHTCSHHVRVLFDHDSCYIHFATTNKRDMYSPELVYHIGVHS
jgi:ABC-type proline/glycine betaine transport system substrate-binding protein